MRRKGYGIRYRDGLSIYANIDPLKAFLRWVELGPREYEIYCFDLDSLDILWSV